MPTALTRWIVGCIALVAMLCSSTLVAWAACQDCPEVQDSCCPLGEAQAASADHDDERVSSDESKLGQAPSDCCDDGELFMAAPTLEQESWTPQFQEQLRAPARALLISETAWVSPRDRRLRERAAPPRAVPVPTKSIVLLR